MKYLFIVQGEGRGHMTQAISLRNKLAWSGHEVSSVIIGKSVQREIPAFFREKIKSELHTIQSPNFVVDKNKRINITKSVLINLYYIRRYLKSLRSIHKIIKKEQPDVIINFYDLLGGIYSLLYKPSVQYYCVGHQYLIYHPEFQFPKGYKIDKFLLKLNTKLTSFRADKLLALSFREMPNVPEKNLYVVPPLLRKSVLKLTPTNEGFIHGYILNQGYATDIIEWHKKHPHSIAHFFWDKKDADEETLVHKNLIFHQINDVKFLDFMSRCKGYATTAGFESICEAMYLGKPIMMVPTEGHYEQMCNALDAELSGAGISNSEFNLSDLIEYIPKHNNDHRTFKKWADCANTIFLSLLIPVQNYSLKNKNLMTYNYMSIHNNW